MKMPVKTDSVVGWVIDDALEIVLASQQLSSTPEQSKQMATTMSPPKRGSCDEAAKPMDPTEGIKGGSVWSAVILYQTICGCQLSLI